jgi:hypothetical protein
LKKIPRLGMVLKVGNISKRQRVDLLFHIVEFITMNLVGCGLAIPLSRLFVCSDLY